MKWVISQSTIKSPFLKTLQEECGEKVSHCYQCGKCSAGCPMAFEMDYLPNQIIRMVQLGMEKQVLSSRTISLCAACYTCTTRCPRNIDLAEVMDYLRRKAYKKQIESADKQKMPLFNKIFLRNIERNGRLNEISLTAMFNITSGDFLKDLSLMPKIFLKGKIRILPYKNKNIKEIKRIFKKAGRQSNAERDRIFKPGFMLSGMFSKKRKAE